MVERINFGQLSDVIEIPDLIEIQTRSYRDFLQMEAAPMKRRAVGLQAVFKEVFPIESYDGHCTLDFVKYEVTPPKQPAFESLKEGNLLFLKIGVDGRGRMKIGDAFWTAEGEDLPQGARVRVISANNMSLQVRAVD